MSERDDMAEKLRKLEALAQELIDWIAINAIKGQKFAEDTLRDFREIMGKDA